MSACRSSSPSVTTQLRGLAASSLTGVLTDTGAAFHRAHRDTAVTFSFEGSQQVVAQLKQGVSADLAATASSADMDTLTSAGIVESATAFATNRLEILVAKGNPKSINGLADLARTDVAVVLAAPEVPAGKYAAQALARAAVIVHPRSLELDVKSAVRRVVLGDADAAVVYVTDVKTAGSATSGVAIPPSENITATYKIGIVRSSAHKARARLLIATLRGETGRTILTTSGFGLP
jgi:molybdate transport system substrate-binding protein